ncbi:MAG: hypothetical protein ACXQS2_04315 [Methermicoccaceae archaeon]
MPKKFRVSLDIFDEDANRAVKILNLINIFQHAQKASRHAGIEYRELLNIIQGYLGRDKDWWLKSFEEVDKRLSLFIEREILPKLEGTVEEGLVLPIVLLKKQSELLSRIEGHIIFLIEKLGELGGQVREEDERKGR